MPSRRNSEGKTKPSLTISKISQDLVTKTKAVKKLPSVTALLAAESSLKSAKELTENFEFQAKLEKARMVVNEIVNVKDELKGQMEEIGDCIMSLEKILGGLDG